LAPAGTTFAACAWRNLFRAGQRFRAWPAAAIAAELAGCQPDLPVVLYAGRLDVDKRVDRVIRAAAAVNGRA
jgi:glycosyltransferase involved in cell wall biosynthesis